MEAARLAFTIERVEQWSSQTCMHACLAMAAGFTADKMQAYAKAEGLDGPQGPAGAILLAGRLGFAAVPVPILGAQMALTSGHYLAFVPSEVYGPGFHCVLIQLFDSGIFKIYDPSRGREFEKKSPDTLPAFHYIALYDLLTLPRPPQTGGA